MLRRNISVENDESPSSGIWLYQIQFVFAFWIFQFKWKCLNPMLKVQKVKIHLLFLHQCTSIHNAQTKCGLSVKSVDKGRWQHFLVKAPEPCETTCNFKKTLCFFYCVGRLLPRIIIICSCTSLLRPRAQGTQCRFIARATEPFLNSVRMAGSAPPSTDWECVTYISC